MIFVLWMFESFWRYIGIVFLIVLVGALLVSMIEAARGKS